MSAPRAVLVALFALAGPSLARAACPASPEMVVETSRRAAEAFAAMSAADFAVARDTLRDEIACLRAAPDPAQAAAVHQALALGHFQAKDAPATVEALLAMHEADPSWALSADIAPPGGPLSRRDQEARALPPSPRSPRPLAPGWTLVVDGRVDTELPSARRALVVLLDPAREVAWSGLASAAEVPAEIGAPPRRAAAATSRTANRKGTRPGPPLLLSAGGTALVSGGLWLAFASGNRELRAIEALPDGARTDADWLAAGLDPMSAEEVGALWDRTRRLEVAAEVSAGVAVGLGAVGLVFAW